MSNGFAEQEPRTRDAGAARNAFVPVLLLALAMLTSVSVQLVFLIGENRSLAAASAALGPQELAAGKIRASLDTLASATARLASAGNPGARAIVEQLQSRGITINAPASSAAR